MTFIADSQLLSLCQKRVGFLWLSLQIFNYYHLAQGGLNFYDFYYRFPIIVTSPKVG